MEEKEKTKQIAIFITGVLIAIAFIGTTIVIYNKFEWEHEQEMAKAGYVKEYKDFGRKVWVKQQ